MLEANNNKFIDVFKQVMSNHLVKKKVCKILDLSDDAASFINYFGINYSSTDVLSVKLYFSYLKMPSDELFDLFGVNQKHIEFIKKHWNPVTNYSFVHEGFTFALKCYLKKEEILMNNYFGFRSPTTLLGLPSLINLKDEDLFYPGYCVEYSTPADFAEKKYFFIRSIENKIQLINRFNLSGVLSENELVEIEYAEHKANSKINLGVKSTDVIQKLFEHDNNKLINTFNNWLFSEHQLYYYGYGVRLNTDVKAIYYLPKHALGQFLPFQTIPTFLK